MPSLILWDKAVKRFNNPYLTDWHNHWQSLGLRLDPAAPGGLCEEFRKQEGPVCDLWLKDGFSTNSAAPTLPTTHRLKQTPNFSSVPYSGYPQITAVQATCQFTLKSCWWPRLKLPKCQPEVRDCSVCLEGKKLWYKYLLLSSICIWVGFTFCCGKLA